MYKIDDIRQKLIDHMMGMDMDNLSFADLNMYALIISQLALTDKHEFPPYAPLGFGLGALATPPVAEEVK